MPDKPTDKKLTFLEWLAKEEDATVERMGINLHKLINDALYATSIHKGDCTDETLPCSLCTLEEWLSEYRQYFTQK